MKYRTFLILQVIFIFMLYGFIKHAHAEKLNIERLAQAVYLAEGAHKTNHPYGLVTASHWCKTEPGWCKYYAKEILQIHANRCANKKDKINCISTYYAPRGVKNDPTDLNKNWTKNVKYFYENLSQ